MNRWSKKGRYLNGINQLDGGARGTAPPKVECRVKVSLAVALCAAVTVQPVNAQIQKNFEFDVAGVLPSSDPDISYCTGVGGLSETAAFSVPGDGFLHQTMFGTTVGTVYIFGGCGAHNGTLDPTQSFSLEASVQFSTATGNGAPAFIEAGDGAFIYGIWMSETNGLEVPTETGSQFVPLDVLQPHVYRIDSPGNSSEMRIFVDGALKLVATAPSSSLNFFEWGGGSSGGVPSTSDGVWDYVRFSQPASPPPGVPAVSDWGLAVMSLLVITAGTSVYLRRRPIQA